jgi:hypothetical protein
MNSPRLQLLVDRIRFAREYTLGLLNDFHDDEWFAMPGGITHVAWQAGHLAFAQYRICMARIRGERPEDEQLFSSHLLKLFGAASTPSPDPTEYPSPEEIRSVMARVHEAALAEISRLGDLELDEPSLLKPHRLFNTKLGALSWCPMHEMTHAGQLGLLRRLMGKRPQW